MTQATATPTLCECGCGEPVNPLLDLARELRDLRWNYAQIGRELGISKHYARVLLLNPPRFRKGHQAHVQVYRTMTCEGCGNDFRTCATDKHYCHRPSCPANRLFGPRHKEYIKRYDSRQHATVQAMRRTRKLERREWARDDARAVRQRIREKEAERRKAAREQERRKQRARTRVRRELAAARKVGRDPWWYGRRPQSGLLSPEARRELDELVFMQKMEMARSERGWGEGGTYTRSLDQTIGEDWSLGETLTSRMDFTAHGDIERMMRTNGAAAAPGIRLTTGERLADDDDY